MDRTTTPSIRPDYFQAQTMASREIAELVESNHADVKRSIDRMASKGVIPIPPLAGYLDALGRTGQTEYLLDKRSSYIIVAQLSPEFTARLVDRWQELEAQVAKPAFALPDFTNPAAAARAWADAVELSQSLAIQSAQQQTQLAIAAPKADALDRIADAEGSMCITDAAKHLQMAPKHLFSWLAVNDWIYRRPGNAHWIAYQPRLKSGVLEHKVTTVQGRDGAEKVVEQVLVTAKGLVRLAQVAA